MAKQVHSSITAIAYARSLLELATERNQAVPVGEELTGLREIVESNPTFAEFLADPAVSEADRSGAIGRIFRGRLSDLMMNFLGVLERHHRLRLIAEIENAYADLLDEQLGNVEVDVTTAVGLTSEQVEQVRQRIGKAIGKNAIVHQYVDESILGGLVLRVRDKLIDASVRYQLRAIRQKLLAKRPAF